MNYSNSQRAGVIFLSPYYYFALTTDGWWLDQIFDTILSENAELIIYKYKAEKEEDVKNIFIQSCIRHRDSRKEDIELVKRRIYVVSFEYNNTYFLGLEKKE